MRKYSCIIVDDEPLARDIISHYVGMIPQLEVVNQCSNAIEAKYILESTVPDILFLDINMPNLNGLELLSILKTQPATILTTAYSEYALKGYEYNVVDYLLKPIEFDRFFKACTKAIDKIEMGKSVMLSVEKEIIEVQDYFFVKSDYKMIKVFFNDILFIEALQKYVRIHTKESRIVTLMSMNALEETLAPKKFNRIHRSYIINIDKIDSIEGNQVNIGKHQLPISKGQRETFMELIKDRAWDNKSR